MTKRLLLLWITGSCLLISCEQADLILVEESDPNGLYTPYLKSIRNDREVILKWERPSCAFCGGCPCPQLDPDYFEILFSDTDPSELRSYSTVDNGIFELSIDNLENEKPYYFRIKAVISNKKYTMSSTIMVIPDLPEHVNPIFQTVNKNTALGSWSPDEFSVTYVSDYVWNNGNNSAQSVFVSSLSSNENYLIEKSSRSPQWSSIGDKIVYHTDNNEVNTSIGYRPTHIAVYNVNDGSALRLTEGNSFNYLPSWSPDGAWIAYLSDKATGNEYNIWKVPSTGGAPIQITSDFNDLNELAIIDDRSPKTLSWSSDGKNIAFSRLTKSNTSNRDIYSVPSSGGIKSTIVTSPWNDDCPAYSPDGKTLAFISNRSGINEVWTFDLETEKLRQITGSTGKWIYENSGKIEWSASGNKILFTSYAGDFSSLYSVNIK